MYVYFPLRIEDVIKKVSINRKSHSNFAPCSVLLYNSYRAGAKIGMGFTIDTDLLNNFFDT